MPPLHIYQPTEPTHANFPSIVLLIVAWIITAAAANARRELAKWVIQHLANFCACQKCGQRSALPVPDKIQELLADEGQHAEP